MSDTFDKVTQNRDIHARQTKLELMGDYASHFTDTEDKNHFLFVVTVEEEEQEDTIDTEWEGSINKMRKFTKQRFTFFEEKLDKHMAKINEQIETNAKRDITQDRNL